MANSLKESLTNLTLAFGKGVGSTEDIAEADKEVMARLGSDALGWKWIIYEAEIQGEDILFFGRVIGWESELGYFTLENLEISEAYITMDFAENLYEHL
jgi:hypothetical protein